MTKTHKKLRITLLVDQECYFDEDPNYLGITSESKRTCEYFVYNSFKKNGHTISVFPFNNDAHALIAELKRNTPDIVFNLVQHFKYDRSKEILIPALLDLLNLKYTGPDSFGGMLSIDKKLGKDILRQNGILVPNCIEISPQMKFDFSKIIYPVFVKPNYEGGSTNITNESLAKNQAQLKKALKRMFQLQHKSVLIESFIVGKEVTILLIGNSNNVSIFHPHEILFPKSKIGWGFLTQKLKYNKKYREKQRLYSSKIMDKAQIKEIKKIAFDVFNILKMRDYTRIDLRITSKGEIYVIDTNCNPGLTPAKGSLIDLFDGKSFDFIMQSIINAALNRT